MKVASVGLGLLLAALLQLAGVRAWPEFPLAFDLLLVAVVYFARDGRAVAALAVGSVGGLVADALAGGPLGLHGFADTLVAYTTARVAQQLVVERPSGVLLAFTLASALQQALLAVLGVLLLPSVQLPAAPWIVARAVTTGLLGLLLATGGGALAARLAAGDAARHERRRAARRR